jgi:chromosome segregation ATPase
MASEGKPRAADVDRRYLERIAGLREQLNAALIERGRLEGERLDASSEFARESAPNLASYEAQMRSLSNQIVAERKLIADLKARLADAGEAARHAGVPHPGAASTEPASRGEREKRYRDRIVTLRIQIDAAQQELAKLQGKAMEEPQGFKRTDVAVPAEEMQVPSAELATEIESQRKLVASLKSQLGDLEDEARHAGVPHAAE